MQMTRFPLAAGFAATLLAGLIAPGVLADSAVPLGGGAGIVVDGSYCKPELRKSLHCWSESAPSGFRTPDPLIKSQLLYQLS
jgi:hypothetical protein